MAYTGFRGLASSAGAVQTVYTDQPGIAVTGMLAFAHDANFVDSYLVNDANGVYAGAGITLPFATPANSRLQRPDQVVIMPVQGKALADFGGVVVFNESMQSDANGIPGWDDGRSAQILRPGRGGGRIWVDAIDAFDPASSGVFWVVAGGSDGKYKAGQFSPAALAGNATVGYTVDIGTLAKVKSVAAAGGLVILEFGL